MAKRFDLTLRVAGEGGEGVMSAGELTALGFARLGINVYTFRTNPPEIKGGPAMFQLRISDAPVLSQGDNPDFLLCFNQEAWELHGGDLAPGGTLMYDPAECQLPAATRASRVIALPLTQIARDEVGAVRSKNVVAVGVMAAFAGMPMENMADLVRQKWGKRKQEILDANIKALELGYKYVHDNISESDEMRMPAIEAPGPTVMMSGNEGLSLGAAAAGLDCFFGYPITPASDVMEWLAKRLPMFGGTVVQTEDEISAITACVGAGFAGSKTATASSGPGLSLMAEGLGLATMEEVPLVVFDCQRSGPSTGMPTKTEQGDVYLAIFGTHGDAPRIVVAPRDVNDCIWATVGAVNLAEKFQTPVIVLSDQTLSFRTQTIPRPDFENLDLVDRKRPDVEAVLKSEAEGGHGYLRYELTADHISPMAVPGRDPFPYVATGLEHNEHAHIDQTPAGHTVMSDKRARKIESAALEPGWVEVYGDPAADVGIICFGSTAGPAEEALQLLHDRGIEAKVLFLRMLWPIREAEVRDFMKGCRLVVLPELNHSGQYAHVLKARLYGHSAAPIIQVTKVTGLPFGAAELAEQVEQALSRSRSGAAQ